MHALACPHTNARTHTHTHTRIHAHTPGQHGAAQQGVQRRRRHATCPHGRQHAAVQGQRQHAHHPRLLLRKHVQVLLAVQAVQGGLLQCGRQRLLLLLLLPGFWGSLFLDSRHGGAGAALAVTAATAAAAAGSAGRPVTNTTSITVGADKAWVAGLDGGAGGGGAAAKVHRRHAQGCEEAVQVGFGGNERGDGAHVVDGEGQAAVGLRHTW